MSARPRVHMIRSTVNETATERQNAITLRLTSRLRTARSAYERSRTTPILDGEGMRLLRRRCGYNDDCVFARVGLSVIRITQNVVNEF